MASKAELWDQLSKAIKIVDNIYKAGASNSPNVAGMVDTLQQAYEGSHIGTTERNINALRTKYSELIRSYNSSLDALILELARVGYNSIATSVSAALDDIAAGMNGSETVKNRAFTFDTTVAAGGSNVGNGTLYRVYRDKYDANIEAGQFIQGTIRARVITDRSNGVSAGAEAAILYGVGTGKVDEIELGNAPNGQQSLNAVKSADSTIGTNLSFDTASGSNATTFDNWTLTAFTASDFAIYTSDYFRKSPGLTTGQCCQFKLNNTITQTVNAASIDYSRPVMLIVRAKRLSSCDGTMTIRLGIKSKAVALSAQSGWFDTYIGVDADDDGWYDNFKEDNSGNGFRVAVDLASRTTGTLLIDEIILAQPVLWNGIYYLLTAGSTDYLKEDYFEYVDSVSNTGVNQTWLARLYSKHLPHTSGSPTYADA